MRYPLSMWCVVVFLTLLKYAGGSITRESQKNLHNHMTKREIEYYFGVKDHSEIPEYDVTTPRETESNGRVMSYFRHRRSASHPDVMHYKLHAFGSKLQLRLKRNMELMAPNLVIETHHGDGVVTTHPAPRNKFYLGKVSSDPGSLVAMRSDRGLTGMVKTAGDTLFVQPLPTHLAKRVRRNADTVPHLIYRASPLKQDASGCQTHKMESATDRVERSRFTNRRKPRAANDDSNSGFKYIEAALIAPQHYVDKYGTDKFATVLLVIANMVAGMFQDPSIGKYKAYYVITKIFHIKSVENELGFTAGMATGTKLNKLAAWAAKYISKSDKNPEHFDVFSFLTDKIVGGRALANQMCKPSNGNINADVGLQSALIVAHEIGHNMWLDHDNSPECPGGTYIMSGSLPTGPYAATWSNCSRRVLEGFIGSNTRSACMNDSPFSDSIQTLPIADQKKLPGEIFDGDYQCRMQYGDGFRLSPFRKGICGSLYCISGGTELSRRAPLADGSTCGIRNWCIGGKCEDNGKKRIDGRWSNWGSWNSKCTRACGGGVQYRTRQCTNPPPTYGGKDCEGLDKQWRICNSAPCAEDNPTFRKQQCSEKVPGSSPYNRGAAFACSLYCRSGSVVASKGVVSDGTRCYFDIKKLDVCIGGQCRRVGCDNKLDSLAMLDRCGVCGGDGDTCFKVTGNYTNTHTEIGPENGDLVIELVVGITDAVIQMRKATNNYLGVQTENGTYLVGGHLGRSQTVKAAGTTIVYTHNKNKFKDSITMAGPSNAVLRVMYIFKKGTNPGLDYSFVRPAQPGDPKGTYEWLTSDWSSCSATCGHGVRTRLVRCIRSDDQSAASDNGCSGIPKPASQERCPGINCPSVWYTTPWSDCSKSCGNGKQTREVKCIMYVTLNEYVQSDNCSSNKTVITDSLRPCNSFACDPDWDTKEGLDRDECGDPIEPNSLFCYRMDQLGKKSLVPPLLCHQLPKPTRLPCTTPSPPSTPSTRPSTPTELPKTTKTVKKKPSQGIQAQCSLLLTTLALLLHLTCAA